MNLPTFNLYDDSLENRSMSDGAMAWDDQGCGMVWVGNPEGVAPALGCLALAFAKGRDFFGYRLAGRKFKTVLLTSSAHAKLIDRKLLAGRTDGDLPTLLTFDDLLEDRDKRLTSTQIARRLDRKLRDAEIVIVDGYASGHESDQSTEGFAPVDYEVALQNYFMAAISQHVSTIFVGYGHPPEGRKRWDLEIVFDHELSLYRFVSESAKLNFLVHWLKSGGADMPVDQLQVSRLRKSKSGAYRWRIETGVLKSDPIKEFAFHLRQQGLFYQRIGDLLGCGRSTVHRWVTANRSATSSESR